MELIPDLFSTPLWQSLIRALIHSLWIGPVILGLAVLTIGYLPTRKTGLRYLGMLCAQVSLFGITCLLWGVFHHPLEEQSTNVSTHSIVSESRATTSLIDTPQASPEFSAIETANRFALDWQNWLAPIWLIGVVFFLLRLLRDANRARKTWRNGHAISAELANRINPIIADLSKHLDISKAISIKVTDCLHHPAVSGIIKPVIILPARFLDKATPKALRAVLAHELAHIRRHDFLINVIQRILESFLFFNPAIWLLGSLVRSEREACCDAMAIEAIGEKLEYVQGVTDWISESTDFPAGGFAPAINGGSSSGMVDRIKRILFPGSRPQVPLRATTFLTALGIISVSIYLLHLGAMKITKFLSDDERIAVSKEIRSELGDDYFAHPNPYQLKITIEHLDGSKPTKQELKNLSLTISTKSPQQSGTYCRSVPSGTLTHKIKGGICRVKITSLEWATFEMPFTSPPEGQDELKIKIKLDPGTPAWLALTDAEGQPAKGVKISLLHGASNGSWTLAQSDSKGLVHLALNSKSLYGMMIRDSAYAWMDVKSVEVSPDQTVPITLKKASPIKLLFRSRETGQPIEGWIREAASFFYTNTPALATTDETGTAVLNVLAADDIRDFSFKSKQGHCVFLTKLSPGIASEQVFELPAPVTVSGWIDLSGQNPPAPDQSGRYPIKVSGSASWEPRYWQGWNKTIYTSSVLDGKALFSFTGNWPGDLRLNCGSYNAQLELEGKSIKNVVLNRDSMAPETLTSENTTVDMIFRFHGSKKTILNSKVTYSYTRMVDGNMQFEQGWGDVVDNVLRINEIPVSFPLTIELDPDGVDGFWFSPFRHTINTEAELPLGGKPIENEITLLPAGGIQVAVFEADGSPAGGIHASVVHIPGKGKDKYQMPDVKSSSNPDDRINGFFAGPLPIGGVYRIRVSRDDSYVIGPPVSISKQEPFQNLRLQFKQGVTVTGKLIDVEGKPVFGAPIRLGFETDDFGSFGNGGTKTDIQGEFQFSDVDLNNGGTYRLVVDDPEYEWSMPPSKMKSVIVSKQNHTDILLTVKPRKL